MRHRRWIGWPVAVAILAAAGGATAAAPDGGAPPDAAPATPATAGPAAAGARPQEKPALASPEGFAYPSSQPGDPTEPHPSSAPTAPPSVASPPPPGAPRPRRRRLHNKRGFFMMPFVGIHSYQQAEAANTDPGLRIGSVMGGRLSDLFSLNGEVHADLTNPGDLPAGTKISELTFSGCFSPLVQIHDENIEFVLGPKIGGFLVQQRISNGLGNSAADGLGLLIGLNFGMFYPVSPATSVGVLLSLELAKLTMVCEDSVCDMNVDAPASQIVGLTAAALF